MYNHTRTPLRQGLYPFPSSSQFPLSLPFCYPPRSHSVNPDRTVCVLPVPAPRPARDLRLRVPGVQRVHRNRTPAPALLDRPLAADESPRPVAVAARLVAPRLGHRTALARGADEVRRAEGLERGRTRGYDGTVDLDDRPKVDLFFKLACLGVK